VIKQLTDNLFFDQSSYLSNNQVTWFGYDGTGYGALFYDGNITIPLTSGVPTDIDNGQVVIAGLVAGDLEILFYDGSQIIPLTNPGKTDVHPSLHNGQVTWESQWHDANWNYHFEILLYNGTFPFIPVSDTPFSDDSPEIYNGQITWRRLWDPSGTPEVYLYDGNSTILLTEQDYRGGSFPKIDNGQVVWHGTAGPIGADAAEIFLYDGALPPRRLTTNTQPDFNPQIHNGQVVWQRWDGNDWEIYFYDGVNAPIPLTDNTWDDVWPSIHNGQIVWHRWDGTDWDIYFDDGSHVNPEPITINDYYDGQAKIHNGYITWTGYDGNDYEIFLAEPKTIEILDGVAFSAGAEISSDPEVLAVGGEAVEGAVTDGVTRLLLRKTLDSPGTVTLTLEGTGNPDEDGVLRSIDGSQQDNSITVDSVTTSEGEMILATYLAPTNFVREFYAAEDKIVSEREISLKIEYSTGSSAREPIRLVRPPLVLVHGLFSDPHNVD